MLLGGSGGVLGLMWKVPLNPVCVTLNPQGRENSLVNGSLSIMLLYVETLIALSISSVFFLFLPAPLPLSLSPWIPPCLQHRPWILGAYGIWASWCVLGAHGTAIIFLHTLISFCVAQFRSLALTWLCSLLLLSTLRLQDVEEVKVSVAILPWGREALFGSTSVG